MGKHGRCARTRLQLEMEQISFLDPIWAMLVDAETAFGLASSNLLTYLVVVVYFFEKDLPNSQALIRRLSFRESSLLRPRVKRSKEKWESSIRVKEDTEELQTELTSGGREFHRRHDEGMKEERYREEEQARSSTVPVLRRLYLHRLFTDFGMREERQGGPWLFTSFQK